PGAWPAGDIGDGIFRIPSGVPATGFGGGGDCGVEAPRVHLPDNSGNLFVGGVGVCGAAGGGQGIGILAGDGVEPQSDYAALVEILLVHDCIDGHSYYWCGMLLCWTFCGDAALPGCDGLCV